MTREELLEKLNEIQKAKCETRTLEIKAAEYGCPSKLYDTLSSFSNQDEGGVIVFGVNEKKDYEECGVYDPQDIQKKINEQCLQMDPVVRPLLTVAERNGKSFVAAEIPGIDLADRPCHYRGKGRIKGSYIRVGDSDEPMTEYEVYSYEAYRRKYEDEIRPVPRTDFSALNPALLEDYIRRLMLQRPNMSALPKEDVYRLMGLIDGDSVTLSALLLFCRYPQVYLPQLCITAVVLPGESIGEPGETGERFTDNQRIEGNISDMLDQALSFIQRNMKVKTIVNPVSGRREDRGDYPIPAIREAVLNTLVHRDYSIHTEGMPIQILMYPNRIEIRNPGGIYGRLKLDQLGKLQPDTRNPVLATAMELLGLTENRYSGIPTIRKSMKEYGLLEPVFADERGTFVVTLYNEGSPHAKAGLRELTSREADLLDFLSEPRSRQEIAAHLGIGTVSYAIQKHVEPLMDAGRVRMTIPDKPRSHSQRYVRCE